jgi:hypothetical protein
MTAGRERSKGGCWTCKLRKKKCDEDHPLCKTCVSLQITCHGYGSKPTWMNGGAAEKEIIEVLRQKVKETTSLKRKSRGRRYHNHQTPINNHEADGGNELAHVPRVLDPSSDESFRTSLRSARTIDWPPPQSKSPSAINSLTHEQSSSCPSEFNHNNWKPTLNEDETGLLMHYLDYVFPLQFPFYNHTVATGGRGWLLSLLLQVEPLYHAALSIASYHQHYELYYRLYESQHGITLLCDLPVCHRLEEQSRRYILSIERLQQHLKQMSSKTGMMLNRQIEVLVCMIVLVSLEVGSLFYLFTQSITDSHGQVFKSECSGWQIHLRAASELLPTVCEAFKKANTLGTDMEVSETNREAFHFFGAALKWYIIPYFTTSLLSMPSAAQHEPSLSSSHMPMRRFTGCDEWVIDQLLKVIELKHWKDTMQAKKQLSVLELATRAMEIKSCLEGEVGKIPKRIKDSSVSLVEHHSEGGSLIVTQVWAYATLVYLHVIVSGSNPELPEIHNNVSKVIQAFKALPDPEVVRSLPWPLCIAGCMAAGVQENEFRAIVDRAGIGRFPFGNSRKVVELMEECWRTRANVEDESGGLLGQGIEVDWRSVMWSSGVDLLLV